MVRLGLLCVAIIIVCGGFGESIVAAQARDPWLDSPVIKLSEMPVSDGVRTKGSCSGSMIPITVTGTSLETPACVYGSNSGARVARYKDEVGVTRYAVSFPSDVKFYELRDMCVGNQNCFYSQVEDTALLEHSLEGQSSVIRRVNNFSGQLTRHQQAGTVYYTLNPQLGASMTMPNQANVRSMAISANGVWGVFEAEGVGLARVDMRTSEVRWIASVSGASGGSTDPPSLTISNSGQLIAKIGWHQSLEVVVVSETCGTTKNVLELGEQCPVKKFDADPQFHGDTFGVSPRFTDNGKQLSFIADSGESVKKIVVSPQAYEGLFNPHYLAFGDSFTSGEGEVDDAFYLPQTNSATNKCHVSNRSYPYKLASAWDVLTTNHACSGSRIADVRAKSNLILADVSQQPSLLSVGVGGNDVDLIGKLKTCLGPGTCQWALPGNRAATINEMKRLLPELVGLIYELQRNASAPLFLVGYPSVVNPKEDATCSAMIAVMLSHDERRYIDESIRYLNKIIKTATIYTETTYVDIEEALQGERLCDDSEQSMNAVRLGDDIAPFSALKNLKIIGAESFHPTPRGHQRIGSVAELQLANIWQSAYCGNCQADLQPSPYWELGATAAQLLVTQYSQGFIVSETVAGGSAIRLSFPAGTFSPNTGVRIELHSTPQEIATVQASADGSLVAAVTVPYGVEGYHSFHAIGHSFSGEMVDIYQTAYIDKGVAPQQKEVKPSVGGMSGERVLATANKVAFQTAASIPEVLGVHTTETTSFALAAQPVDEKPIKPPYYFLYIFLVGMLLCIILLLLLIRRV